MFSNEKNYENGLTYEAKEYTRITHFGVHEMEVLESSKNFLPSSRAGSLWWLEHSELHLPVRDDIGLFNRPAAGGSRWGACYVVVQRLGRPFDAQGAGTLRVLFRLIFK